MTRLHDANCRLGGYPWGVVGGSAVPDLLSAMDRLGIERALVSHTMAWRHDPATGNRRVVAELRGQQRLRPCWVALPESCGELDKPDRFVAAALAAGVGAMRVYPKDHGFDLDDPDFAHYAAAFAEAGLPLLVDLAEAGWRPIEALATAHPRLAVIVCQTGYRVLRQAMAVLGRTENVHLDLSDLSTHEGLEWLAATVGPHRLVFGTGGPLRDPAEAVTRLLWSELSDDDAAAVGHANLEAMLPGPGVFG
ncbi:amidohydrolase family protein [Labedaea rhizosphaerae]|uniref:Amidohydrolase family protein n=1 Tax=Labedaea rhizosphaerae TaxID=598644 RepID=A0A4R6S5A5_LABRH|nr:amidohydrolase family protein [Labedaea rhizosphaerae]TDP94841.1 amidohydrolase family protein [Labedaea rhizosphaerae]